MRLLHSKAVPGPISLVTLCHEMDLVAVAARSSIVLHNALSFQRLFQLTTPAEVTALLWSPTGKLLAAGLANGEVHLYRVEDGKCVVRFSASATAEAVSSARMVHQHTTAVTHMCWVSRRLPKAWSDSEHGLLHAIDTFLPPVAGEGDHLSPFKHLVQASAEEVSILACLSAGGLVDFKVYGWFPIQHLQLPSLLSPPLPALPAGGHRCHGLALAADHGRLDVLLSAPAASPDLLRAAVPLAALHRHPVAVATVAAHCAYLREMLGIVEGAGRWLQSTWADTTALLTKKFQFLVDDLAAAGLAVDPAAALLYLHVTGTMGKTLHTFLDCNFTAKHCQKVEAALHSQIHKLVRRVVEVLQPGLAHVILTVEELLSAVFCDPAVYGSFGLHSEPLQELMEEAKLYLQRTHSLLTDLREAKAGMLELLHWLNKQQARAERVLAVVGRARSPWTAEEQRSVDVCRITRLLQSGVLWPRLPFLEGGPPDDARSMRAVHQRLERLLGAAFGDPPPPPPAAAVGLDRIAPAALLCNPQAVAAHVPASGAAGLAHFAVGLVAPQTRRNVLVVLREPLSGPTPALESGTCWLEWGDELLACCLAPVGEAVHLLCLVSRNRSAVPETFVALLDLEQLSFLPFDAASIHQALHAGVAETHAAGLGPPTALPRPLTPQHAPLLCCSGKRGTACVATAQPGTVLLWDMEDSEEDGPEEEDMAAEA